MTGRRGIPAVRRRRLGFELRRYRELAGFTIDHVAERLRCSASKISRLETGHTGVSPRDVQAMLTMYGIAGTEFDDLMQVARETRQRGWWQTYGSVLTGAYVSFEAAAQSIRSYECQCVPGLLQTEEYAHNLIQIARPELTPDGISSRVRVRLARQGRLTQDDPVTFQCVIDEAALRRPVGGWDVMRRQFDHLLSVTEHPNVTWQVLTLSSGAHPGMDGSFVLLHFAADRDPDTVYVGIATGGVFLEKADELQRHEEIFSYLTGSALTPDESAAFVASLAKEHM